MDRPWTDIAFLPTVTAWHRSTPAACTGYAFHVPVLAAIASESRGQLHHGSIIMYCRSQCPNRLLPLAIAGMRPERDTPAWLWLQILMSHGLFFPCFFTSPAASRSRCRSAKQTLLAGANGRAADTILVHHYSFTRYQRRTPCARGLQSIHRANRIASESGAPKNAISRRRCSCMSKGNPAANPAALYPTVHTAVDHLGTSSSSVECIELQLQKKLRNLLKCMHPE
jgi:hypothetical protein